jgi:hypothetical protein
MRRANVGINSPSESITAPTPSPFTGKDVKPELTARITPDASSLLAHHVAIERGPRMLAANDMIVHARRISLSMAMAPRMLAKHLLTKWRTKAD